MKTIAYASIFALFLMSLAAPWSTTAQTSGPSASGSYKFVLEDDLTRYVEFNARTDERGNTTGQMTFTDQSRIVEQDVDDVGDPKDDSPPEFFMTAQLDSLTIEHNRAVMSGTVTDSSHKTYIGRWVQLVVEDNGDGKEIPDKVSWCFCQPEPGGWTPSDAEVKGDEGAWWKWWATDAELKDDVGVASTNIIPGTKKGCQIFPLSAYDFAEVKSGDGQIQVLP